jgi:MoxR-like ATPase
MGYPDKKSEMDIYNGRSNASLEKVNEVINVDEIKSMRDKVERVYIEDSLLDYLVTLVRNSRENQYVSLGISPRGGIALIKMSKSMAFMDDRDYVVPEDILSCLEPVSLHRIVLNSKAKANGYTEIDILNELKDSVKIP